MSLLEENQSNSLKLIAIITMTIDHIGAVFFPEIAMFRIIGRVSFPIFAYQLSVGFRHTTNIYKYIERLLILAIVSQVPYFLLFKTNNLNIFFTLFLALFVLMEVESKNSYVLIPALLVAEVLKMPYGAYGILLVLFFYNTKNDLKAKDFFLFIITTTAYVVIKNSYYQICSIYSLLIIFFLKMPRIRLNKKLFYWFYPIHLLVLIIIRYYISTIK